MKRILAFFSCAIVAVAAMAQYDCGWLRSHDISPDGRTIVFVSQGKLYSVGVDGGMATLLTHGGNDANPVFSPDGRQIAFSSDRDGSTSVYVMPSTGGTPKRVTWRSGSGAPVLWVDNDNVVFSMQVMPTVIDATFPGGSFPHLYKVNVARHQDMPQLFSEVTMSQPSALRDGKLLYADVRGYEDVWRKHQTSPMARDIWMRDANGNHTRLTTYVGEDRNPVWDAKDKNAFYYVSEQSGTMNIHRRTLDGEDKQLTHFKDAPVRYLHASNEGTLSFSHDGSLYVMKSGGKPVKLKITLNSDNYTSDPQPTYRQSGASQLSVADDQIAFVLNEEIYVTSEEYKTTKRITDNQYNERHVSISPDGRSVVFDREVDGRWRIVKSTIKDEKEKKMSYCTVMDEKELTNGDFQAQQPQFSPDGKKIAFLKNRVELVVMDADGGKQKTVLAKDFNYSYRDGDKSFSWSPDSRWLLMNYQGNGGWNNADVCIVSADGQKVVNLTNSGYSENGARWCLGGKAVLFNSDRTGYRSHGSWGAQDDVYITFLDRETYERFLMDKEEREVIYKKVEEKPESTDTKGKKDDKKKDDKDKKKDDKNKTTTETTGDTTTGTGTKEKPEEIFNPDFDPIHLEHRTRRLTRHSASIGSSVLSKDGTKLYYVSSDNLGTALWEVNLENGNISRKSSDISWDRLLLSKDEASVYYCQSGRIKKMTLSSGSAKSIDFDAEYTFYRDKRWEQHLAHIYYTAKEKLYDPKMNGCDWDKVYNLHRKHLPFIHNGRDFAELAGEMLGELNVSHSGCRYSGSSNGPQTAQLGIFTTDGIVIDEILVGGPLDGIEGVKAGSRIEAIDGQKVVATTDYSPLLAGKAGKHVRLTIDGKVHIIKPITLARQNELLYTRWVEGRRKLVDSLSHGQLAYVHIKAMNAASFNTLFKELLAESNRTRKAVIVDVRHNGGGWLHNDVIGLLTGVNVASYKPRGQEIGLEPYAQWTKPSCMLVCEDCYSNAHGTPWLYKTRGVGKLIGAPVAGTMTAVWWENIGDGLVYGIPEVPLVDKTGTPLENQTLQPDITILSTADQLARGYDAQLERAIEEMMK